MKKIWTTCFLLSFFLLNNIILSAQGITATEIVRKADEKFNGEKSSIMVMSMTIIRPTWQRTVEFKNWSLGSYLCINSDYCSGKRCGSDLFKKRY